MSNPADSQILDAVTQQFLTAAGNASHAVFMAAQAIFVGLAVIQITWSGLKMLIKGNHTEDYFSEILWQVLIMSIFYFVVLNASWVLPEILNVFIKIGASAEPISTLDPSSVAAQGLSISASILKNFGWTGLLSNLVGALILGCAVIAVAIAFGLIAIELMITLIQAYFQVALAPIFLAFGAKEYLRDVASGYFKSSIALGVKLFVLYLVIGAGESIAASWGAMAADAAKNMDIEASLAILIGAISFYKVANVLPGYFAGMVHGAHSGGGGAGAAMIGGFIGGASTAAAVASGGAALAATAATGAMKTSMAAGYLGSIASSHYGHSGGGVLQSAGQGISKAVGSGVSAAMHSAKDHVKEGSKFLQHLSDKRDAARPPQESSS